MPDEISGSKTPTDPPGDLLVKILSEQTSAIERQTEAMLGLARLVAANGWEFEKAAREAVSAAQDAAAAALAAATAARAAEAAVNVFAEEHGNRLVFERHLEQDVKLLRVEVRRALSRLSGVELELADATEERRLALVKDRNGHDQ